MAGVALSVGAGSSLANHGAPPGMQWIVPVVSFACLTTFANIHNDLVDASADKAEGKNRPIATGEIAPRQAAVLMGVLILAYTALVAPKHFATFAVGCLLLALALLYNYHLKSTVLLGNLLIALLGASAIPWGAWWGHVPSARAILPALILFGHLLAFEVLKTLRDRAGDHASGITTIATRYGRHASVVVVIASSVVTDLLILVSAPAASSYSFAPAIFLLSGLPNTCIALRLGFARATNLALAQRLMTATWWPGLLCIALLY